MCGGGEESRGEWHEGDTDERLLPAMLQPLLGSEELSRLVAEAGGPEALLAMPERAGALLGRYFSIAGMAAKIVSRALSLAQQNEVGRDDCI